MFIQLCVILFFNILSNFLGNAQSSNSGSNTICNKAFCENRCTFGRVQELGYCIDKVTNTVCDCGSKLALTILIVIVVLLVIGRILVRCFCVKDGLTSTGSSHFLMPSQSYPIDVIGHRSITRGLNLESEGCIVSSCTTSCEYSNPTISTNSTGCIRMINNTNSNESIQTEQQEVTFDLPPSYSEVMARQ